MNLIPENGGFPEGPPDRGDVRARTPAVRPTFGQDGAGLSRLSRVLQALLTSIPEGSPDAAERVDRIDEPDVMALVDRFLDLGPGARGFSADIPGEKRGEALKVLADLLKRGVVGYEYRKINGRPQKVFIDVAIGSDLHRAPLWRGRRLDGML